MESYKVKVGWPVSVEWNERTLQQETKYNMREDLNYFMITIKEISYEAHMNHQRVSNIANNVGSVATIEEIYNLSVSFNHILKKRKRLTYIEENFVFDNQ